MIRFQNVHVNFEVKNKIIEAVKDVSFEINRGEIFGIVGTSGAGKSTLLRTINLLQKPSKGRVVINGKDITDLKGEELRQHRAKTGMVFQHFNLIHTKTVFENVAFAMKAAGKSREEINKRVPEVLELVGLSDRATAYPSKLSGGQKQRVGIARAIANNPEILLCDEPTSALDLETTNSILELLKKINKQLGITTVIISHEMNVIKKICDRVAVMKDAEVVEIDTVYNVFASPKHPFSRQLVNYTINLELPKRLFREKGKRLLKIVYRGERAEEPVISDIIKHFGVDINILHGKIEYISDQPIGILVVHIDGNKDVITAAEEYLKTRVPEVEVLNE
ncbi:MAG: ATP-binding cassette domain-containing protein [Clostridiaceae bacterium]|nr:ATP-binding cassette domain-containing protein [Clostridiaceae bacterium]